MSSVFVITKPHSHFGQNILSQAIVGYCLPPHLCFTPNKIIVNVRILFTNIFRKFKPIHYSRMPLRFYLSRRTLPTLDNIYIWAFHLLFSEQACVLSPQGLILSSSYQCTKYNFHNKCQIIYYLKVH